MPVHTKSRAKTVTVEVTDTILVNNNPDRVQLTISNNGTNVVHVDIDNTVATNSGLRIAPSGTLTLNKLEDGNLVTRQWIGIATGASSNVRVFEVIKKKELES